MLQIITWSTRMKVEAKALLNMLLTLSPLSKIRLTRLGSSTPMRYSSRLRVADCWRSRSPLLALQESRHRTSPLFIADSLEAWKRSESSQYAGMLLMRPEVSTGWNLQAYIDDFSRSGGFGKREKLVRDVANDEPQELARRLGRVSDELLANMSLPCNIRQQIQDDICSIGSVLGRICSHASTLQVTLEIMGENVCRRWHRDYYVGRAIVTYNSHATLYSADDNVNFWEMENCGNDDHIIRDSSQIQQVGVGDVLFMKGKEFPNSEGLVHKSPEVRYHEDGRVINRLILKVDVP